ncbi:MAG: LysR family transcriptional regulator [Burkholderiales bacterium]|nr:LysR family transcriptional regulator [Burkholderiales bacterium]
MARNFDPVQLGSIELFCKAAELANFTAAARVLGITPAAVSRSVGRLEARLGVRLFVRSTRLIRLTDDGEVYYEQCRQALQKIKDAEQAISGTQSKPSGLLRISTPTTYGHYRLLPLLPKFMAKYPDVTLELHISNRNIDFIEEGYDLAIRLGVAPDSRLIARKLEDVSLGVFASPSYLQKHGVPRDLKALEQHQCIQFVLPSTGRSMPWIFQQEGRNIDFNFTSRMRVQEDILGCVNYAKAGGGLFQIYHFIVKNEVERGELKEVLTDYAGRTRCFNLLYPQNRHLSTRVRCFVDFLINEIQR